MSGAVQIWNRSRTQRAYGDHVSPVGEANLPGDAKNLAESLRTVRTR